MSRATVTLSGEHVYHRWSGATEFADPAAEPTPGESAVFPEVATFTRVCAYTGQAPVLMTGRSAASDPVTQPTTAQAGVADLGTLLQAAREPGPYVLVGASWGGPEAVRDPAAFHLTVTEGGSIRSAS